MLHALQYLDDYSLIYLVSFIMLCIFILHIYKYYLEKDVTKLPRIYGGKNAKNFGPENFILSPDSLYLLT